MRSASLRRSTPDAARAVCLVLALAGVAAPAHAVSPDELLDPEQAFRISTEGVDERNVQVRFEIAEGYYMYRDRFKFATGSGRVLADVDLPPGEPKRDQLVALGQRLGANSTPTWLLRTARSARAR